MTLEKTANNFLRRTEDKGAEKPQCDVPIQGHRIMRMKSGGQQWSAATEV